MIYFILKYLFFIEKNYKVKIDELAYVLYNYYNKGGKMLFKIELESKKAIYQQIVDKIILAIAKGELKPNDSLPSIRSHI